MRKQKEKLLKGIFIKTATWIGLLKKFNELGLRHLGEIYPHNYKDEDIVPIDEYELKELKLNDLETFLSFWFLIDKEFIEIVPNEYIPEEIYDPSTLYCIVNKNIEEKFKNMFKETV